MDSLLFSSKKEEKRAFSQIFFIQKPIGGITTLDRECRTLNGSISKNQRSPINFFWSTDDQHMWEVLHLSIKNTENSQCFKKERSRYVLHCLNSKTISSFPVIIKEMEFILIYLQNVWGEIRGTSLFLRKMKWHLGLFEPNWCTVFLLRSIQFSNLWKTGKLRSKTFDSKWREAKEE